MGGNLVHEITTLLAYPGEIWVGRGQHITNVPEGLALNTKFGNTDGRPGGSEEVDLNEGHVRRLRHFGAFCLRCNS
jgi:hypothetical protein